MRVLVCPGSFKGSLSAVKASRIISSQFKKHFLTEQLPLADGGDGSLEVFKYFMGGMEKKTKTVDPLGKPIWTRYLWIDSKTALIDLSLSSALKLVDASSKPALFGNTYGTGVVIKKAVEEGAKKIILCLGGSATVDGGTGILQALGAIFLDGRGKKINPMGANISRIGKVDIGGINPETTRVKFMLLSDVKNPLLGKNSGIKQFSAQKGADPEETKSLVNSFSNYRDVLFGITGKDVGNKEFLGSAGGAASSIYAFFDTEIESGSDYVAKIAGFEVKLRNSDLAVTGEGKVDLTSGQGKITGFVAEKAAQAGIPSIVLTGCSSSKLKGASVLPIILKPMLFDEALESAENNLRYVSDQIALLIYQILKRRQCNV
ncbi:glycerate kinase [candidate division WOR-3 bacterium]|nr:glycerate kinase [candidate division WOR-3 bacterium]